MKEEKKTDIVYFQNEQFKDSKMEHIFSTRIGWDQDDIISSLRKIYNLKDEDIIRARQVHGNDVLIVDENYDIEKEYAVDGFITNLKGKMLVTYHADCTPVYFYDPVKEVVAMVHSGWRGSLEEISSKVLRIFEEKYFSKLKDIKVLIGPSICADCYEVKEDVSQPFLKKFGPEVIKKIEDRTYLSVTDAIVISLKNNGISSSQIINSSQCTSCDDRLYSYRKEATKSRMIAGIMLKEED